MLAYFFRRLLFNGNVTFFLGFFSCWTNNFTRSLSGRIFLCNTCCATVEKIVLQILNVCRTGPYFLTWGVTSQSRHTNWSWLIFLISHCTEQLLHSVLFLHVGSRVWSASGLIRLLQLQTGPNLCPGRLCSLGEPLALILTQSRVAEQLQQRAECFLQYSLT